jgi:hypothetical protein
VALLDALEAEHSAIDPLLAAIDAALADRDSGPQRLGELTDALATALRAHLDHEEAEVAEDEALVDNLFDDSLPDRIPVGVGEVVRHIDALRAWRDDVFKAILRSQLRPAEERRCVGRDAGGNVSQDLRLCS